MRKSGRIRIAVARNSSAMSSSVVREVLSFINFCSSVRQEYLHGAALRCAIEGGGCVRERHAFRNHGSNVDDAELEHFERWLEAAAAGADQGDLIHDDWRGVERDLAVHGGF